MFDSIIQELAPYQSIGAFLSPFLPFIPKVPAALRSFHRWRKNRHRKKEADLNFKMKRYVQYQTNDLVLRADNKLDLFLTSWVCIAGMLPLASALVSFFDDTPAHNYIGMALLVEAFACFYLGAHWFSRSADRLHKCRNPEKARLLFEIELMEIRLGRLRSEISKDFSPMLSNEALLHKRVSKKLPDWFIET